jgi:hypothetical protein
MIMKSSKVILLFTAAVIMVVIIIFSVILRNTIQIRRSAEHVVIYRTLPLGDFNRLKLSDYMHVSIRQGKECRVEYPTATDSLKLLVNNLNGTLHIQADSTFGSANRNLAAVKITMPLLFEIAADHGADIQMGFFEMDSIRITLGEGCIFNGSNNTLKQVTFKTSGDAQINISSSF